MRQGWGYWLVTGALIGTAMIGILSIGAPLLLVGTGMLFYGIFRVGSSGCWAALVGFGALPAGLMLSTYITVERCPADRVLRIPAGAPPGTHVTCGDVPQSYLTMGLPFTAIALIGAIWGLVGQHMRARMRNAG